MEIKEITDKINNIIDELFVKESQSFLLFNEISGDIRKIYEEFIDLIPRLNSIGMDFNIKSVMEEIVDVNDAIENEDKVKLFDVLKYRIVKTISIYGEIKEIMEQN